MVRVAHVITTLEVGGAERLLHDVVAANDPTGERTVVISLDTVGAIGARLRERGVEVHGLDLGRSAGTPGEARSPTTAARAPLAAAAGVARLARLLRRVGPDVVQTWMYHADLVGGLAVRAGRVPASVAWGVHASDLPAGAVPRATLMIRRLDAALSRIVPDAIVCSSQASADLHADLGYDTGRLVVIRNGFDVATADPDAVARVRRELGLERRRLVVRAARWHAQKDYPTFLAAVAALLDRHEDVLVACCGAGIESANRELRALVEATGHASRIRLLGLRDDVPALHAAADVAVSSSAFGETFPLAVGEAMGQGTAVVATDVGDCADLVGDTGEVVPPGDATELAAAIERLLPVAGPRGAAARARVRERFDVSATAAHYEALHIRLAAARRPDGRGAVG